MAVDDADFREDGKFHFLWLELIRMILEWEDGAESASDFAKRLIKFFCGKEVA